MTLCPHGVNLKHTHCGNCEEDTNTEHKAAKSPLPAKVTTEDRSPFEIDRYNLDLEWASQPDLAETWYKKLAETQYDVDEAERHLELTEAELYKDIREYPKKYNLERLTEEALKQAIRIQPTYQEAYKKLNRCKQKMGYNKAGTSAVEHKKKGIEGEVQLWLAGYFADPKIRGDRESREAIEEMKEARRKERIRKRNSEQ